MLDPRNPSDLTTPQKLEQVFSTIGWQALISDFGNRDTELGRLIRARGILASNSRYEILKALEELRHDDNVAASGMRTLMCAQIGDADDALNMRFDDSLIRTDWDRMGASWHYAGRCIAHAQLESFSEALESLGVAKLYARLLGIHTRVALLEIESLRLRNLIGQPDPDQIQALMEHPEQTPPRRHWLGLIYVASRWGTGEYNLALASSEPGSDLAYLSGALLGQNQPRPENDLSINVRVADCWMQLWRRQHVMSVSATYTSTAAVYGRLASAISLCTSPATAAQALDIIGHNPPLRADQAALWAAVAMSAFARGATPRNPLELPELLSRSLSNLSNAQHVLHIIQEFMPEAIVLADMGTKRNGELSYRQIHLPKLVGSYIVCHGERLSIGEAGLNEVLAGMRAEPTTTVDAANLGVVAHAIRRLASEAEDQELAMLSAHWTAAMQELVSLFDPKLNSIIRPKNFHCNPMKKDRTLLA